MAEKFDVVVIGSGPGGYAAAIRCAQRGTLVAVAEKEYIGGTCLNCGCIPSKALLASAHTLLLAKNAANMGIDIPSVNPNWAKMQVRKDAIVSGFRKGLTGLIQSHKVKILTGRATVVAPGKIKITKDASTEQVETDKIILATGSESVQIPAFPFDGQKVISSKEALNMKQIPASMVIIGGGVIGCELACVYASMGTKITIVEALASLIPMEDEWVGKLLEREFKKLGIEALTSQKVISVDTSGPAVKINIESGQTIEAEKVLVSVGRRAVCDKETIEALKLQMNGSRIAINDKMETSAAGVYAIGDAVGTTYLAHGAFAEAEVAAINATKGNEKMTNYDLIPKAVYTFPEVASVGKNEQTCKKQGIDISIGKSFFKANGRSAAHNETIGEIRTIRDKSNNKVLGVAMVGSMVTELIAAARAIIGSSEKITDISFPHPTVSEVLKESVEDAFGLSLHNPPSA